MADPVVAGFTVAGNAGLALASASGLSAPGLSEALATLAAAFDLRADKRRRDFFAKVVEQLRKDGTTFSEVAGFIASRADEDHVQETIFLHLSNVLRADESAIPAIGVLAASCIADETRPDRFTRSLLEFLSTSTREELLAARKICETGLCLCDRHETAHVVIYGRSAMDRGRIYAAAPTRPDDQLTKTMTRIDVAAGFDSVRLLVDRHILFEDLDSTWTPDPSSPQFRMDARITPSDLRRVFSVLSTIDPG